jgi:uncharacterized protein
MKKLFVDKKITYDGEQLKPLTNYLKHQVLGDSIVSWVGPCQVTVEHMIDGEDLLAGAQIAADEMVHFVLELFDFPLKAGVLLQRLMAEMATDVIEDLSGKSFKFHRSGDDIYLDEKKLNISIATVSSNSTLIHFAVNAKPTGAPVPISCLQDFSVDTKSFALALMEKVAVEFDDVRSAAQKVRSF